jgi:ankyrin repeat protein
MFRLLIRLKAKISPPLPLSRTPLHVAVDIGHYKLARVILQDSQHFGDSKNERDTNGQTPLHLAAKNGDSGMVALLIKFNANFNIRDVDGRTPNDVALLHNCNEEVIEQFGFEDMIVKFRGSKRSSL